MPLCRLTYRLEKPAAFGCEYTWLLLLDAFIVDLLLRCFSRCLISKSLIESVWNQLCRDPLLRL